MTSSFPTLDPERVLAALGHGLPQLCMPQGADQFINSAAVASAGAGISLMPDEATAEAVRAAVSRHFTEKSFGPAARRLGESMVSMPSPDEVSAILEAMA